MDVNYAIPFMSKDWIVANTLSVLYIIIVMGIGKFLSKEKRITFIKYFIYLAYVFVSKQNLHGR